MEDLDDLHLLRAYAEGGSEEAFGTLVTRHVDKVYSVALRHTGNPHTAEEITQAVFVILAKKARQLRQDVVLYHWLYKTARLTSWAYLRGEARRSRWEEEACMQNTPEETKAPEVWPEIAPLLDTALAALNETDRRALVLRFFYGKSMQDIGGDLGANEAAIKKRLARALEKLRNYFGKRGVHSTIAALEGAMLANAVLVPPAGLAKTATAVALAKGVTASVSIATLIKGALKIMAWTQAKTAILVGVGIVFAAGTATVTVKEIDDHRTYPWQGKEGVITFDQVRQPPQVKIVSSRFHQADAFVGDTLLGTGLPAQEVIAHAYGFWTPARAVFNVSLPASRFDYIACLAGGQEANQKALQAAVKSKFGVVGKTETRGADVWLLTVKSAGAPGLKPNQSGNVGNSFGAVSGGFHAWNEPIDGLAFGLEDGANVPIIDQTGLTNRFDFELACPETAVKNRDWEAVNLALDELGLELVHTNMPIEMLVVDQAR